MKFTLLLLLLHSWSFAQNLVPNPSFENNIALPNMFGQSNLIEHWFNPNISNTGSSSDIATPDYLHIDGNSSGQLPFMLGYGEVHPYVGSAITHLILYQETSGAYREYITTKLFCALQIGESYEISFRYTYGSPNADCYECGAQIDEIQLLFTEEAVTQINTTPILLSPQVSTVNTIYDSLWHEVTFEYTADKNYHYVTIGNFLPDGDFSISLIQEAEKPTVNIFIDDVSIKPIAQSYIPCVDTIVCASQEIIVESIFEDEIVEWYDLNDLPNPILVGLNYTFSPEDTTDLLAVFEGDTAHYTINTVEPFPDFSIGDDTLICEFGPSEFFSVAPNYQPENATYSWNNGSSYSSVSTQNPITFSLEMMDEYHCYYTDTIVITEETYLDVLDLGDNHTFCEGETPPDIIVNVLPFAFDSIVWSSGETTQIIQPTQTGWYYVDVFKEHCIESDGVYINVKPLPQLPFMGDTALCLGEEYELIPDLSNNGMAIWNIFNTDDTYTVEDSEEVHLRIVNECGTIEGTHNVVFEDCIYNEECRVFVPNVFSPNDDGINDQLQVFSNCEIENILFQVFDRWGSIAFETDDLSKSWAGDFGQDNYALGTSYVYRLSYNIVGEDEVKYQHGSIAIMR